MTQEYEPVGRININPIHQPLIWHDLLACTICGALVLGEHTVKAPKQLGHTPSATTVTHAKWHQQLQEKLVWGYSGDR
jgi:hypothetical protein